MKSFLPVLLLFWAASFAAADDPEPAPSHLQCNFADIMELCGGTYVGSIDDEVYGNRTLSEWTTNVVNKVEAYAAKLENGDNVEGSDNPDVAISYCFMHYICFDPLIEQGQEHNVYTCMKRLCPRIEGIEEWCEGMNT